MTGSVGEHLCTFMVSRCILHPLRDVLVKSCRRNQNTHFYDQLIFGYASRAVLLSFGGESFVF
jgi:hypothetical protein